MSGQDQCPHPKPLGFFPLLFAMIVTVFNYGSKTSVPITPHTTVSDIIECCRDPGDEHCKLICPEIEGKPLLNWL
ncbi:hypothetical protein YQE_09018, partial [Dendroctonus ponderosae]